MSIKSFKENKENPFYSDTVMHIDRGVKTIKMGDSNSIIVNTKTSELEPGIVAFHKKIPIDKTKFTKVYLDNLTSFFELTKAGQKVLEYLLKSLKPNKGQVLFDYTECKEFTGYSSTSTITSGLSDLIKNKFIARSTKAYIYYINPTIFFNGNRMIWIKEFTTSSNDGKIKTKEIDSNI